MRDAQRTKAEHADKATPEALAAKKNERERRSEASASGKRAGRGVALVETGAVVASSRLSRRGFNTSQAQEDKLQPHPLNFPAPPYHNECGNDDPANCDTNTPANKLNSSSEDSK